MTDNCSQSCEVGVSTEQPKEEAKPQPKYVDLCETDNSKLSGFLTKAEELLNAEMKRRLPFSNQAFKSPPGALSEPFGVSPNQTLSVGVSKRSPFGSSKMQPSKVHFDRLKFQQGCFQIEELFPWSVCSTCDGFKMLCGSVDQIQEPFRQTALAESQGSRQSVRLASVPKDKRDIQRFVRVRSGGELMRGKCRVCWPIPRSPTSLWLAQWQAR